jgi:hypothetical protein
MCLRTGIATLLLCVLAHSSASALSLKSSVDKSRITVGDPVTYVLTIRYSQDEQIIRAPETEELFGPFEVRGFRRIPGKKDRNGTTEDRVEYVMTAYETGKHEIPSVSVVFTTASGDTTQVRSDPMSIEVESVMPQLGATGVEPEETDIHDIRPPAKIARGGLGWLLWAGVVALVALVMGSYVWYKHRLELWRRRVSELEKPVDELAEFDKIAVLRLLEKGEYKTLHILLSEALRRYIERRWDIDAMERTTYEIVYMMRDRDLLEEHIAMVRDYLDDCDLVKFAKYVPSAEVMAGMVDRGKDIVRATKRFDGLAEEVPGPVALQDQATGEPVVRVPDSDTGESS